MDTPAPAAETRRVTVRVTGDCNNRCIFCAQVGIGAEPLELPRELEVLRRSASEITFVGGEPTLWPGLVDAVRAARAAGFEAVGVQSNGAGLVAPGALQSLRDAGLSDVLVSLHGAEAPIHDYHTGTPGSFALLMSALALAREAELTIAATTVLTRSSFRTLAALPPLFRAHGVKAWLVLLPHAAGRVGGAFDRVMPRLGLALPFALHALTEARRSGLAAWIQGAPLCLLGPLTSFALPEPPRAHPEHCNGCDARPLCPGVDPNYLARFAGDELRPRPPPAEVGAASELSRLFVGVGPLAPGGVPVPVTPAVRSLPMLSKVRPGLSEVARGKNQRSGEALREILPELFDGRDDG